MICANATEGEVDAKDRTCVRRGRLFSLVYETDLENPHKSTRSNVKKKKEMRTAKKKCPQLAPAQPTHTHKGPLTHTIASVTYRRQQQRRPNAFCKRSGYLTSKCNIHSWTCTRRGCFVNARQIRHSGDSLQGFRVEKGIKEKIVRELENINGPQKGRGKKGGEEITRYFRKIKTTHIHESYKGWDGHHHILHAGAIIRPNPHRVARMVPQRCKPAMQI